MRKCNLLFAVALLSLFGTASNAVEIHQIGNIDTPHQALKVTIMGNLAYVADMESGVRVIDITDPEEPDEIGHYNTPGMAHSVSISGQYAFVADYTSGLLVLDISDPENLERVDVIQTRSAAHVVKVIDEYAYIADWAGLCILDVSDPENPDEVAYLNTPGNAFDIFVQNGFAYIADQASGLRIIDVSDPENPEEVGSYNTQDWALGVYLVGDIAYVGARGNGLHVVDVSNPEEPEQLGVCDTPGSAHSLTVVGNYAYVGDTNGGLRMIDISNSEDPEEVAHCNTQNYVIGSCIIGNLVYVANWTSGLTVLRVTGLGLSIQPLEIDFEEVGINLSRDLPLTIENSSANDITVSDITVEGEYFSVDIEEEFTLEPNEEQEINVTFAPEERGEFEGSLLITSDDEYNEEIEISLRGIGLGPILILHPQALEFGEVGLNVASEKVLTISNQGLNNLIISNISSNNEVFTADFEEEITLEPDAETEINVTFTPNESAEFEGILTIISNDPQNEEVEVELSGDGVGAVCWFNPRALEFGVVGIDVGSEQTINFRNRGLIDLVISDISNEDEVFTTNFEGEVAIEPNEYHSLIVTFTPTDGIAYADTLIITTNDPERETIAVPLSGRGIGAVIVVEHDTVVFGEVGINHSAESVINIRNEGEIDLNILEIFTEGHFFSIDLDDDTTYVVEPEGSLECTVTFAPEEIGDFRATLFISCDDRQREEVEVPLYGTGKGPEIAVDADSLDFGLLSVGESKELIVTISAVGLTDLTITDVTVRGAPTFLSEIENEVFIELNNCFELPISFNPGNDGLLTGVITIHSNDPEKGELEIPLIGCAHHGIMIDTLGTITDLIIAGDLAYLTTQNDLFILNITNPEEPVIAGSYHAEGLNALSVFVNDEHAFITTGDSGFTIVDISIVDSMQFVSSYDTDGYAHKITVNDGYAYVADGEAGLRVIDLYDLERPAEVSYVDTPGEAYAVTIAGNYAYVADYVHGLRIIDISDPQEPEEVGYFNTRGWSYDVSISGGFVYVADERYGLRIIEVSDPSNPEEIGFYDTEGNAFGIHVVGNHAYVADGEGGMYMLDISLPEAPSPVKIFYTPGIADAVQVTNNYAFIADRSDLLIVNITEYVSIDKLTEDAIPTGFILQPAFPNPFNAVTSIRYGLPYSSHVSIGIHDVTGRKIDELYTGEDAAGFQTIRWNAEGFRSGVYLVRLEASGFIMVQKIMLIR